MAALLSLRAWAAAEPGFSSAWFARVWQAEEGLPGNSVTGVAQTSDGYLWVSTQNGLARFDGLRFERIPLPIPSGRVFPLIRCLMLGRDGQLWLALEGALAVGVAPGRTNVFTSRDGLVNFRPLVTTQDGTGAVWIGYVDGSACRIAEGKVTRFTARDGLAGTGGCWLATDENGQLWFAKAGRIGVFRAGAFVMLETLADKRLRLARRRGGGMWISAGLEVFTYEEGGVPVRVNELTPPRTGVEPAVLFEDREAALWIGTFGGGLFRCQGTNVARVETSHGDIQCLAQDREANLWVGTVGGGLDRLRLRVLALQGTDAGLPSETVRSVCEDATGVMWAATGNGGLARLQHGVWVPVSTNDGWSGERATCVASDRNGGVWIGTYRAGLHHWQRGRSTSLGRSEGLAGETLRALLADSAGNLWLGLESPIGLQRLRDGRLDTFTQPSGSRAIRTMAEDATGNIWMGTSDGFLLRVSGNTLVNETPHTLPRPKPIRFLSATPDGSLWIAYAGAGLGRWRAGRFGRITTEQGLRDDYICAIAADSGGGVWFSSDHGIFQARQRELDAVAEGKGARVLSIAYGRDEALPNLQGSYGYGPGAAKSQDGRLWFPMRTGLAVVHPDRVQPNRIPPAVLLEGIWMDARPVPLPRDGVALRVAPGHHKLELRFAAPTFIAPEGVQFRYRLQGWDEEWVAAGAERKASYSRLPAGDYAFQVTACSNAGVWNEAGATLKFIVQPFVWQTWWFRLGAGTVLAALLGWAIHVYERRRVRRKLEELERRNAIERERTRIARDIHDDLGASLAQIGLLADLGASQSADARQAETSFAKIGARARAAISALDEIVWAANPRNDNLPRLADYLSHLADECFEHGPLRCRKEIPTGLPPIPVGAEARHNLALAVKEALTNALKHSSAQTVWLRLKWEAPDLVVAVEDDGAGMKDPAGGELADGLRNQTARMKDIGGTVAIHSAPDQGTRVSFRVKLGARP